MIGNHRFRQSSALVGLLLCAISGNPDNNQRRIPTLELCSFGIGGEVCDEHKPEFPVEPRVDVTTVDRTVTPTIRTRSSLVPNSERGVLRSSLRVRPIVDGQRIDSADRGPTRVQNDSGSSALCSGCFHFDIDLDGRTDALTDGLLILRYLFGFSGSTLTNGAISSDATRLDSAEIESYLLTNLNEFDIDGDNRQEALTDGLLFLRYLFGFRGSTLTEGATTDASSRTHPNEIVEFVEARLDSDVDGDGMGAVPLFVDRFQPGNINGPTLERWTMQGSCTTSADNSGVNLGAYCLGAATPSHLQTSFNTTGYSNIRLSYGRLPNLDGAFEDGERFVAEWSADGSAPWHLIEESTATEFAGVSFELPEDASGHPDFTLRFSVEADGVGGSELFWMDNVVVTGDVPQCVDHQWKEQYDAPFTDVNGEFVGGSEIFRIVRHGSDLFATNTYWFDENNPWYGTGDQWGQILVKSTEAEEWREDYDLGQGVLRPEVLQSVTFDSAGVNLLLASTYRLESGNYHIDVWTRDDSTGNWTKTTPHSGITPADTHDISVRQVVVHQDTVTGEELILLTVGTQGMLEGRYDADEPGQISWDPLIPVNFNSRAMGMAIANDIVVVGGGNQIWHRVDGAAPTYAMVHDMGDLVADENLEPPQGTYRGMTTIDNPVGAGESILFSWVPDHRSTGIIWRLDPDGVGYTRTAETDIGDLLSAYLEVPVYFSLCTYSYFLPVTNPATGNLEHLGGCLNVIGGNEYPTWAQNEAGTSGHYMGGVYFIRHRDGSYTLREVRGRHNGEDDPRDSIRAIELSPFDDSVYFGGHDSAFLPSTNLAWMYSASLEDVLEVCAD